ncbi:M23 family metallopeptidase [Neobacillus sp. PS3-40]|uniref:M23 family metallopeptidase n=1 Tax=Neobacillus sp. PS3-40 TaxID=3070679 RepID=UPI0027DF8C9D|nr:M23 family metallopeptidase [Neobacillus sp. PS3-40]WML42454.1 M23 family metallopeptidase [Neobacillus sp. PS3-40]
MRFREKISNLLDNLRLLTKPSIKMAAITAVAASAIIFSNGPMALAETPKFITVYYVYLNDTYIGIVSDKEVINQLITEKSKEVKNSYKNVDLQLGSQITYISERVFHSTANDKDTIDNLEKSIQLQAETAAITIDGKPVVYLDSQDTAEQVVKNLELKFVTEDQLKEIEARKASTTPLAPLKENETRLLDVRLSKKVSIEETRISPDKIVTADQAINFLQKGTIEEKKYKVQDGDVLGSIANNHGLTLAQLLVLNPGLTEDSVLKPDQEVNITVPKPYVEVIVEKEINQKEAIPYQNEVVNDASLPKGESREKQQGSNGIQSVTFNLTLQNGIAVKKEITTKKVLEAPINHIVIKGTKVIPSRGEGSFSWPAVGGYISSQMGYRWGKMHKGIDIARPSSYAIKAADNGIVVSAGWDGSYGNKIVIDHQNGYRTVYGHLSTIEIGVGQTVAKGSTIGVMGATGDATGVHLHFEVYKNGALKNPAGYLRR